MRLDVHARDFDEHNELLFKVLSSPLNVAFSYAISLSPVQQFWMRREIPRAPCFQILHRSFFRNANLMK
jgi:hypothetical protein